MAQIQFGGPAGVLVINPSPRSSFSSLFGGGGETTRISYRYSMIPRKQFFSTTATQRMVLGKSISWLLHPFEMTQSNQINGGPPWIPQYKLQPEWQKSKPVWHL